MDHGKVFLEYPVYLFAFYIGDVSYREDFIEINGRSIDYFDELHRNNLRSR